MHSVLQVRPRGDCGSGSCAGSSRKWTVASRHGQHGCVRKPVVGLISLLACAGPDLPCSTVWSASVFTAQDRERRGAYPPFHTGEDLRTVLGQLGFRRDVIPLASFGETYLPHLDARNWARRLAFDVYQRTSRYWDTALCKLGKADT